MTRARNSRWLVAGVVALVCAASVCVAVTRPGDENLSVHASGGADRAPLRVDDVGIADSAPRRPNNAGNQEGKAKPKRGRPSPPSTRPSQPERRSTTTVRPGRPTTTKPTKPTNPVSPTTTTTAPASGAFEVTRRQGYWLAEPDASPAPTARWLMPYVHCCGSWSSDGSRIVFRSSSNTISIIEVATGASRVLVQDPVRSLSDPLWSPDGNHVAIHATHSGQPPSSAVLVVDLDGNEVARLGTWVDGQQGVAWSPDGTRVAFASHNWNTDESWLSVATLGAEPATVATDEGGSALNRFLGLRWSPLGTYLGWNSDGKLGLLHIATGLQRGITTSEPFVYGHGWSPSEDHLVVWGTQLFRVRPDGLARQTLDPLGTNASVDSSSGRIAWTSGRGPGQTRIIVSDPDGSNQRVVLTAAADAAIEGAMWSPVGGRFLFFEYG